MNFYRLVRYHTRGRFFSSLSVRVYNSCHPVTYSRQFCRNKLDQKIYRCMSVRSTQHHTLLHNPTILHTKTFFALAYHPSQINCCMSSRSTRHHKLLNNPTILHTKKIFASLSPALENIVHFKIRFKHTFKSKHFHFSLFRVRVRVGVMVTVQSATHPQLV